MNERIQKLAKQSCEQVFGGEFGEMKLTMLFAEKFAELIIKECLGDYKERIATRYQGSDYDRAVGYGMEIVYYDIVEKFGVE